MVAKQNGIFNQPIAPKPDPRGSMGPQPMKNQPGYDNKKLMYPGGSYFGTGFKAKVGKMRESPSDSPIPQKSMRMPPKSLA